MAKKRKKKSTKKHFKAPWWKLFFVVAVAVLISIPVSNTLDITSSTTTEVLGTKKTPTPTVNKQPVKKTRVVGDIQFYVFYDNNSDGIWDKGEPYIPQQKINVTYYDFRWKLTTGANGYVPFHFDYNYTTPVNESTLTYFTARLLLNPNYRSTNANPVQVNTTNSVKYNASTQTKTLRRKGYYTFGIKAK